MTTTRVVIQQDPFGSWKCSACRGWSQAKDKACQYCNAPKHPVALYAKMKETLG